MCLVGKLCKKKSIALLLYFLLGNSPASEFYMPTFRNSLSVPSSLAGRCEESHLPASEDGIDRVFRNVSI